MIWVLAFLALALAVVAMYLIVIRASALSRRDVPQGLQQRSDIHAVMDQAVQNAPDLFRRAREADHRRRAIACVVCSEPTMIVCADCRRRVCAGHQADHACEHAAGDVA